MSSTLKDPKSPSLFHDETIIPASIPPARISLAMCGGVFSDTGNPDLRRMCRTLASGMDRTVLEMCLRRRSTPLSVRIFRVVLRVGGDLAGSRTPSSLTLAFCVLPPLRTPCLGTLSRCPGTCRPAFCVFAADAGGGASAPTFVIVTVILLLKTDEDLFRQRQSQSDTMEWDAVKAYFANGVHRLVDHQVDSYEDFVRNKLPLIIQSTAPITVWHEQDPVLKKYKYEFRLSFEKVTYMKPRIQEATGRIKPMLPMEARVRNFTYAAQMYADVRFTARTYRGDKYEAFDEESRVFEGISLGKLPVMLGSSLCLLKDYPLSLEQYGDVRTTRLATSSFMAPNEPFCAKRRWPTTESWSFKPRNPPASTPTPWK